MKVHLILAKDESGVGLAELIVATAVASIVLTFAYFVMYAATKGFEATEDSALASRNGARAMEIMTRYMREAEYLDRAADREMTYRADRDDDGEFERVRYYVSGTSLYEEITELVGSSSVRTNRLCSYVQNTASDRIFTYLEDESVEADPDPMTGIDGERLTHTRIIQIRLILDVDTTRKPGPYNITNRIFLRNEI